MIGDWLRTRLARRGAGPAEAPAIPEARDAVAGWLAGRGQATTVFYTTLPSVAVRALAERCPLEAEQTVRAADRVLAHEFDLLGSAPWVPTDPDRAPGPAAYAPIDWRLDPVSGLRFPPPTFAPSEWDLMRMRPGHADIKLPWELARCQHWVTLGQAWRLTGDARYAAEVRDELDDFLAANPTGRGIHWTCTMDVALRAVSWALALELVADAPCAATNVERGWSAVFEHGRFIRANLEDRYEVTSNHFLTNVVGLYYLGWLFEPVPEGASWLRFAEEALGREVNLQVLPDGADFESSVPYHRLVAELILGCARLGALRGRPLDATTLQRLGRMIEYLVAVLRPDGLMPIVGDADDGRLHVLTDYGRWAPQDPRHLLGVAGAFFDVAAWRALGGPASRWEAGWWQLDGEPWPEPQPPSDGARLFPDAGIAVMREGAQYLVVTNGRVGTKGFGNHKHNDQLGFEYHVDGRPVLVDPGSFVYTGNPEARNRFRSTGAHNTLGLDDQEQNELRPEWLFRLFETAHAEHVHWDREGLTYAGRHHGYARLASPVVHARAFRLLPGPGALVWVDRLTGAGGHEVRWHFHWAPGVDVTPMPDGARVRWPGGEGLSLILPDGLAGHAGEDWYSPSYGVRVPVATLDVRCRVVLQGAASWRFAVVRAGRAPWAPAILEAWTALEAVLP